MKMLIGLVVAALAMGRPVMADVFTFQGQLKSGGAAINGTADIQFALRDSLTAGNQIGVVQQLSNATLTNGLLTVDLDFGPGAFNGSPRWLEISVRSPAGSGLFTTLTPRQPVAATPYAMYALNSAGGVPSGSYIFTASPTPPAGYSATGDTLPLPSAWTTRAAIGAARTGIRGGAAVGTRIYVVGGDQSTGTANQAFDTATGAWNTLASIPFGARYSHGIATDGANIYVIGGDQGGPAIATVFQYNVAGNSWAATPSLLTARRLHAVAQLGADVYAFGGINSAGVRTVTCERSTSGGTWNTISPLSVALEGPAAAALNGKIYVCGGFTSSLTGTNTVYEYDPTTGLWNVRAPMPTARYYAGAAGLNGKLYVFGGSIGGSGLNTVEEYDPVANTWTTKAARMNEGRVHPASAAVGGRIYAITGQALSGPSTINEAYDPLKELFMHVKN